MDGRVNYRNEIVLLDGEKTEQCTEIAQFTKTVKFRKKAGLKTVFK